MSHDSDLATLRAIAKGFDEHDLDAMWTFRDGQIVVKDSYWKIREER